MADNQFIARKGLISLDDSQITGSLSITNALTASVLSGSFRGDGTNLYNIPSSGVTGLNLDKIISGSVSASISPNNGFRINTDVYIDGTITAKEFHTDYVTSSVLYQSGSTKFGDTLDDLHEFTGSVRITGSITLNGQAIGTGKLDETTFESFTSSYTTGSFTGSFIGDGSQLTGIDGFPFTGSAKITGSLAVTGSLTVDGNVNATSFTGSIQGTATTASYVNLTNVDGFSAYSSSVSSSINSVLNATTPVTATINNTNSPFTITNQTIVIVDSTNGNVTINLPDLNTVVGTSNQRPIIIYKNDYSQNVVYVQPNGSQLVNGTTQDIIVSIQIGIVYNPTSAGWVTEGTSYQSLAELELFFVPRTETGSLSVSTASYVEYTNVANKPSLVSGSSQISFNGITDKPTLVSGSSQITYSGLTGVPSDIVSGSEQITYSGLTGTPSGIVSGSSQVLNYGIFATTGSNGFNGNQSITGSLTVTGQVVAQTLNVQQVTSSIVYSSGSNIFGNSLSNTQQFTGSVSVTGSLSVNGTSAVVGSGTTNYVPKFTGASIIGNSVIYDNGNQIGIGQTTLFSKFSIADSLSATSVGSNYNPGILNIQNTNTTNGNISLIGFQDASAFINLAAIGSINEVHSSSPNNVKGSLGFYTKNNGTSYITEKMRLDASGNLGIGTTDTQTFRLAVDGPNVSQGDANTTIRIFDTTSATTGTGGGISFAGYFNGTTSFANTLSYIKGGKENSTADNYAAYLAFGTRTNGGAPTERVRINSDGNFLVGATNADVGGSVKGAIIRQNGSIVGAANISSPVHYQSPIAADRMNTMGDGLMYGMWRQGIFQAGIGATNASVMTFFTGNNDSMTERMRISAGTVEVRAAGELRVYRSDNARYGTFYTDNNAVNIAASVDPVRISSPERLEIYTASVERMRITSGGSLQINYNPGGGDVYFRDTTNGAVMFYLIPATYVGTTPFNSNRFLAANSSHISFETGGSERMRITSGGDIGIGNTGFTSTRLTVTGKDNTSSNYSFVANNSSNGNLFWIRNDGLVSYPKINDFTTGNSPNTWINPSSSYGIYINTSSIRYKKDIFDYDKGLNIVNQLRPVYYKGKSEVDGDKQFAGFIAEEIDELGLTEFVNYLEDGRPNSLSYPNMVVLLTKAIQEQQEQIEILKAEIQTLKQ